jgi:hypothetical protein
MDPPISPLIVPEPKPRSIPTTVTTTHRANAVGSVAPESLAAGEGGQYHRYHRAKGRGRSRSRDRDSGHNAARDDDDEARSERYSQDGHGHDHDYGHSHGHGHSHNVEEAEEGKEYTRRHSHAAQSAPTSHHRSAGSSSSSEEQHTGGGTGGAGAPHGGSHHAYEWMACLAIGVYAIHSARSSQVQVRSFDCPRADIRLLILTVQHVT